MSEPMFNAENAPQADSTPEPRPDPKPKRYCSPEQREVNKRNASFSTGPRSKASKDKTKFNGTTHGMRCREPVVLPGEDGSLLKAKVDLWIAELGAETDAERTEVENAM